MVFSSSSALLYDLAVVFMTYLKISSWTSRRTLCVCVFLSFPVHVKRDMQRDENMSCQNEEKGNSATTTATPKENGERSKRVKRLRSNRETVEPHVKGVWKYIIRFRGWQWYITMRCSPFNLLSRSVPMECLVLINKLPEFKFYESFAAANSTRATARARLLPRD